MPGRYAKKLACAILKDQFGGLVESVCRSLILKGVLSFAELGRETGLRPDELRNCLLVLVQHNCVQAFRNEADGTKTPTMYMALVDRILQRLRFPKFLLHIKEALGEEAAESIIEGLMEHGRLSVEQLVQRSAEKSNRAEVVVGGSLKSAFAALVREHYLERVPRPEPVLPPRKAEAPKRMRGQVDGS
ncbi:hypothetical protein CBR_g5700 [Chara braunii]|uniref:DNA-directed RNA polymerase III subunit RPC3 n=1 Tax=Chara braunii TaxID=69332 RepID=A0A388JRV9_CHABU|nr:hypothetical protein CBR_g5700 [Chara braunii]|eukprot:GBG60525.1 hypothetical protein CBR_g5700 [Chara braunii]